MTGFTIGYDCTRANLPSVPRGAQLAGYATGIGSGIPWTAADWAAHPGAIRIAQAASLPADEAVHADVLDVEAGAATIGECAPWAMDAMASFAAVRRPGQRRPAIYFSASNVHAVVNALISGGVTSGVGLWIADWNLSQAQAVADVLAGAGPFPVIGVQFRNAGPYDCDIWSSSWLADVSKAAPKPPPPPPPPAPGRLPAPAGVSVSPHRFVNASWGQVTHAGVPVARYRAELAKGTPDHPVLPPFYGKLVDGTHLADVVIPEGPVVIRVKAADPATDGEFTAWKAVP
jgi:hypothetical protein